MCKDTHAVEWYLPFYDDILCLWIYTKYMIYLLYTRIFKHHLKMAYEIFQTPLQALVQVYKYNRSFYIKAVPGSFWDRESDKPVVTKKSAASPGSCSLFKLPTGPPAAVLLQGEVMVRCATRSKSCQGQMVQHSVRLLFLKTNGFMPMYTALLQPSWDRRVLKIITELGQNLPKN